MKKFKFPAKKIYIIAEAGVNHNQDLQIALKLVDSAVEAKVDAVKWQTFEAQEVVTDKGEMAAYQRKNLGVKKSQLEMVKELELPTEFWPKIKQYCQDKNITFASTPHGGPASVDFLETLDVPFYKVGSGDLTNYILLERIARTKKPVVMSIGMATLDEIKNSVKFLKRKGAPKIVILHCTTNYPCPLKEVNMAVMPKLMQELDVAIGFSDHSQDHLPAILSTLLGAKVYECHFTLDKSLPGPDHLASAEPEELKARVALIRKAEQIRKKFIKQKWDLKQIAEAVIEVLDLSKNDFKQIYQKVKKIWGSDKIEAGPGEKQFVLPIRRSLVAAKNLPKGHLLKLADLKAKRPLKGGVSPEHYEEFIGKKLKRALKKDDQLQFVDVN